VGILSSSVSITRYRVIGEIAQPVMETIQQELTRNAIAEIDGEPARQAMGWTSIDNPYHPDFEKDDVVIGSHLVFSLRIDKKQVSARILKKHVDAEIAAKLAESERDHLSRSEKLAIKEKVMDRLCMQIPATPSIHDVIWQLESASLWFFSNQKAANEALESLFNRSFRLNLLRLFPYTIAHLNLDDATRDALEILRPSRFAETTP